MRVIDDLLTEHQKDSAVDPVVSIVFDHGATEEDVTDYLIAYHYREQANQIAYTDIWLDNTSGYFNNETGEKGYLAEGDTGTCPLKIGDEVRITRGLNIEGTEYTDTLPSIYAEFFEYHPAILHITCIDFWGKLMRYRRHQTTVWDSEPINDMIEYILDQVGLTQQDQVTDITLSFQLTRNARFDHALRRIVSKVPEYPYAGVSENVRFRKILSGSIEDYRYGWNTDHPVIEMNYISTAWRYNKIRVIGALDAFGAEYSGSAENLFQRGYVGLRELILKDPTLTSDALCEQRAISELAYYESASTQIQLTALPCHGLELYDQIMLRTTEWGEEDIKGRVKSYIERYGPGEYQQEIRLLSPSSDIHIEPAEMPDWFIEDDSETKAKVGPAALDAFNIVGAIVRGTDAESNYDTAAKCATEYLASAGRAAQVGDALLVWNSNSSTWRLYIFEDDGVDEWSYITIDGSVT